MANIYLGNTQLGKGGITPTSTLPTANAENYDKHELYLNDGELKYLDKYYSDDFTYTRAYIPNVPSAKYFVDCCVKIDGYVYLYQNGEVKRFDFLTNTTTSLLYIPPTGYDYNGCKIAPHDDNYIYFKAGPRYLFKYDYKNNTSTKLVDYSVSGMMNNNCSFELYNGFIYLFGGARDFGENLGYIYKVNVETGARSRVGNLVITNAYSTHSYKYGNIVYIFVDRTSNNTSQYASVIWKFDLTNETLTQTNLTLPSAIDYYQYCLFNNKLYIIGGQNSSGIQKKVYAFDFVSETFTTLTNELDSYGKRNAGCGVNDNYIYLFFGSDTNGNTNNISKMEFPEIVEYKTLASSDVVNTISFTITSASTNIYAGGTYQATQGMTWSEWVNSAYNTDEFRVDGSNIKKSVALGSFVINGATPSGTIANGSTYATTFIGGGGGN